MDYLCLIRHYAENIKSLQYKVNSKILLGNCFNNSTNLNTKDDAVMLNPEVGDTYTQNVLTQEHMYK